jgi:hypothetical protein
MSKNCTGCGKPATDFIVIAGQRLPYHLECALEARRDALEIRRH